MTDANYKAKRAAKLRAKAVKTFLADLPGMLPKCETHVSERRWATLAHGLTARHFTRSFRSDWHEPGADRVQPVKAGKVATR
jgi:hypothetical protein